MLRSNYLFASLVILLSACSTEVDLGLAGDFLVVDSSGHFLEDVEYHSYGGLHKYKSDGTFEHTEQACEAAGQDMDADGILGEGWIQVYGTTGIYQYFSDSFVMQKTEKATFYQGNWQNLPATIVQSRSEMAYFAEHQFGRAYKAEGTSWVSTEALSTTDSAQPGWGFQDTQTTTTQIVDGNGGFQESITSTITPLGGVSILYYRSNIVGDLEIIPAGTKLSKGATATCRIKCTSNTGQFYDWDNQVLNPPVANDLYYMTGTYTCTGEYLLQSAASMSRDY